LVLLGEYARQMGLTQALNSVPLSHGVRTHRPQTKVSVVGTVLLASGTQLTLMAPAGIVAPLRFWTASGVLRLFGRRVVKSGTIYFWAPVAKPRNGCNPCIPRKRLETAAMIWLLVVRPKREAHKANEQLTRHFLRDSSRASRLCGYAFLTS
jgi:hypothetical protein